MEAKGIRKVQFFDPLTDSRGVTWALKAKRGRRRTIICRICRERESVFFLPDRSTYEPKQGWTTEYHLCRVCTAENFKKPIHAC